jgi:hypothetical protein
MLESRLSSLPRFSLPTVLGILAATWAGLISYDFIFGDYMSSPFEFNLVRVLLPLVGLLPFFVRLVRVDDIADDSDAYDTFVRLTLITVATVVVASILLIVPFEYSHDAIPGGFLSFVIGRAGAYDPPASLSRTSLGAETREAHGARHDARRACIATVSVSRAAQR